MAGWTGAQPRAAGGKFGQGHTAPGKTQAPQPQVLSGITITPEMYQAALKQAAAIIRAQNAANVQKAAISKAMTPAERRAAAAQRRLSGATQSQLRQNAAKLAGQRKKALAAKQRAAKATAAAKAREPGARAAGAAMARSGRSRAGSAAAAPARSTSRTNPHTQSRLREYLAGK